MQKTKLRVFFNYRTVDKPWGGANSFLRALQREFVSDPEIELVTDENEPCDVFFLNQLYRGPGRPDKVRKFLKVSELRRLEQFGTTNLLRSWRDRFLGRIVRPPAIVCRLVNHSKHAYGKANREQKNLFRALPYIGFDIFQTQYLREVFRESGYAKDDSVVIHNGVDQSIFHSHNRVQWKKNEPLVIVSSTMTRRKTKRFDLIAEFSEQSGVKCYHAGLWPEATPSGKVEMLGNLAHDDLAGFFRQKAHAFMHPAEKDICPNAVLEAMSCGLPIFFSTRGGTSELVEHCGESLENGVATALHRMRGSYEEYKNALRDRQPYLSIKRAAAEYKAVVHQGAQSLATHSSRL